MVPEQRVYLSSSNGSGFIRHPTDSGLSFESLKYHLKTNLNIDHSSTYRLIEIGCGYGRMTTLIASYYRLFEVVGTDINPEFIELAKRQERERKQGISYHVCDAGLKIEEELYESF
jgi:ubiquinone/menaquinone biosynthesis C-methylase UbiE